VPAFSLISVGTAGLALVFVLLEEVTALVPFSSCFFVFCNRQRDKLKILHWEHNGFWLYYRRLEKGKFPWRLRRYFFHHQSPGAALVVRWPSPKTA